MIAMMINTIHCFPRMFVNANTEKYEETGRLLRGIFLIETKCWWENWHRCHMLICIPIPCCTGSHSLLSFGTLIIGDTPFPEFSAVVMLDDIQLGYYDLNLKKMTYRQVNSECISQEVANLIFPDACSRMKERTLDFKHQFNLTYGVHTHQAVGGCELLGNNTPGPHRYLNSLNGLDTTEWEFNMAQNTRQVEGLWSKMLNHMERKTMELVYTNVYGPICIKVLRDCLHMWKKYVMKKVKPRVRLLHKKLPDSAGVKVTCLATGFYPRHINLTLLRDGQPVPDHHITGGELLPNGDDTYQMRKSLHISTEELQQHHYICTAEHLSLDNKLDLALDFGPEVDAKPEVTTVAIALGVALLCVVGAIFMRCRRKR
ncbi:hypothetical protein ACEWY4_025720 [Coilia grayii]|uniref:Ig-like domain-containing protein n=1 Tax=Coilia grayii TaxID=363190 RepID=A0ABD1ISQ5_9TELE